MTTSEKFQRVVDILERLRAPGGCPWDREQTFDSIKPYTLEETYEVFEAIEKRDWQELRAELGDLLLQVLFYAQMAREQGHFTIDDVNEGLAQKLVSRHPHVFGDVKANTSAEVLRNWEALKKSEKNDPQRRHMLESVSPSMPALLEAAKISKKAADVGFDWPDIEGIFDKLAEEVAELKQHIKDLPQATKSKGYAGSRGVQIPPELHAKLEDEIGDIFFVVVNLARYLAVDPESALRSSNRKFRGRFNQMEDQLRMVGKNVEGSSLAELEAMWQKSKQSEAN